MEAGYNAWLGQAVVLQVALGDIKVPLRGRLLKEGGETVRMRVGDGWDIDIYKAMILTVEKDGMALIPAGGESTKWIIRYRSTSPSLARHTYWGFPWRRSAEFPGRWELATWSAPATSRSAFSRTK